MRCAPFFGRYAMYNIINSFFEESRLQHIQHWLRGASSPPPSDPLFALRNRIESLAALLPTLYLMQCAMRLMHYNMHECMCVCV